MEEKELNEERVRVLAEKHSSQRKRKAQMCYSRSLEEIKASRAKIDEKEAKINTWICDFSIIIGLILVVPIKIYLIIKRLNPFSIIYEIYLMNKGKPKIDNTAYSNKKTVKIVELIMVKNEKKFILSSFILSSIFVFSIVFSSYFLDKYPYFTAGDLQLLNIIVTTYLLAIILDHFVFKYRAKKGWYGNNEFEAKEIISFIISQVDKDNFDGSGRLVIDIKSSDLNHNINAQSNIGGVPV